MANQFGYPSSNEAAQRILDGRKKAIAAVTSGEGHQIELMSLELGAAIAATRRLLPVTTEVERRGVVAHAIATGRVMTSLTITERAHAITPKAYWSRPAPLTEKPKEENRRHQRP